jgi:D-glycero-D-manno-heptose 1,7-bisphosphate phosphatase
MKVAFLDRDGVINEEVKYLHSIGDFEYTYKCIAGLKVLISLGYKIIIVTNQAGIARGYYTEDDYLALTKWYLSDLEKNGVDILDVFHCPHHIEGVVRELAINCKCRKPNPGMLLEAIEKYNIDIKNSIMIGDKQLDLDAAFNAGIDFCYLISKESRQLNVHKSLYDVSKFIQNKITMSI